MRVCIDNATGLMIESQSGDDGGLDVLIANAVGVGYSAANVTAKVVTNAQYQALLAAVAPPVLDAIDQWDMVSLRIAFNHENRIRALEGKTAITVAQFKAALRVLIGP